jgi:hypothetical protein
MQFGRVARQPLQLKPGRRALSQEGPHRRASVCRQAIPDDQELARNLVQEMLEEADDAVSVKGLTLHLGGDVTCLSERPNDRVVVPRQLAAQDRRLPAGSVRPHDAGQQMISR